MYASFSRFRMNKQATESALKGRAVTVDHPSGTKLTDVVQDAVCTDEETTLIKVQGSWYSRWTV